MTRRLPRLLGGKYPGINFRYFFVNVDTMGEIGGDVIMWIRSATFSFAPSGELRSGTGHLTLLSTWECLRDDVDMRVERAIQLDDGATDKTAGKGWVDSFESMGGRSYANNLEYDPATGDARNFTFTKRNASPDASSKVTLELHRPHPDICVYESRVTHVESREISRLAESKTTAVLNKATGTVTVTQQDDMGEMSWRHY